MHIGNNFATHSTDNVVVCRYKWHTRQYGMLGAVYEILHVTRGLKYITLVWSKVSLLKKLWRGRGGWHRYVIYFYKYNSAPKTRQHTEDVRANNIVQNPRKNSTHKTSYTYYTKHRTHTHTHNTHNTKHHTQPDKIISTHTKPHKKKHMILDRHRIQKIK